MRGTLPRWPKACGSENGNSKPLGVLNREHRELPDHNAKTHMAAHLASSILSTRSLPGPQHRTRLSPGGQRVTAKSHDIIVAFIAGVIAAWISD